jgi:hypothetical protein
MELPSAWSGSNLIARAGVVFTRIVCAVVASPKHAMKTRNTSEVLLRPGNCHHATFMFFISDEPRMIKPHCFEERSNSRQSSWIISF